MDYEKRRKNRSKYTIRSYRIDLLQAEEFFHKDNGISDNDDRLISPSDIRSWIISLNEQCVSNRSICRKISALQSYFKWIEKNLLANNPDATTFYNPMLKILAPKVPKRKISSISEREMKEILNLPYNEDDFTSFRNHLIVEMLYATGMRRAEILTLKHGDISFGNCSINVLGKGNKQRSVPIGEKLIKEITKYIDLKKRLDIKEEFFMVNKDGSRLTEWQLYKYIRTLLAPYNVGERSPHVFRHTCATHLIKEGADIVSIKDLLGHTSLSATEVYVDTNIEELKKEYNNSFNKKFIKQ